MVQACDKIVLKNDFCDVKLKLKNLLDWLKSEVPDLNENDLFDLRVIYNELINNAIIHGNEHDLTKEVEVSVEISDCDISSTIRDDGSGFEHAGRNILALTSENSLCESGRGLLLTCALADYVSFNESGNEVMFKKLYKK